MTSYHSRTAKEWQIVREVETLQALLDDADGCLSCIRSHAWTEGSWKQVYIEANNARASIQAVHEWLAERWQELYGVATGEE